MRTRQGSPLLRVIHNIVDRHCDEHTSDRDLLIRFVENRDENAFTTLVRRHGSMVMGVGLRLLHHYQDAEDVCQATFLLLAKKANTTAWRDSVANWLYEVAYHLSLKARQAAEKRKAHEGKVQPKTPADPLADITARDLQHVLDEELCGLAKKYRTPLLLCCLEGKSRDEAARFLGVPLSTVISRLEEGRELLRRRLTRRGVPLSLALAGATLFSETARAAVPATLARATSQVALKVIAGEVITNLVSTNVSALVKGGMQTMFLIKLKVAMAALLLAGLVVSAALISGLNGPQESALAAQPAALNKDKSPTEIAPAAEQDAPKVMKPGKWVNSLAYCNDGKTVAIVIWNGPPRADTQAGSVVLWDLQKGKVQQTLEEFDENTLQFWRVTSSKDGTTIAASATKNKEVEYGAIRVWEAKTGNLLQTFEFSRQVTYAVALSADGKKVAGGDRVTANGEVCVWDVPSGKLLHRLPTPKMGHSALALSEDGKWIASGGHADSDGNNTKNKVMVWELETGKVKHEWTDPNIGGDIGALAFSPDSKLLAVGGLDDATVRVLDVQTGKPKYQLSGNVFRKLAFSPDGKTLAGTSMDGKIILWDVAKEKAREPLPGHDKDDQGRGPWVLDAVFSPDGRTLASGGGDGTIRLWPVAPAQSKK